MGPVRFFACGEYGETTFRPHYHLALFGLRDPALVEKCWTHGFVKVDPMTLERAMYLCGYVVKKLTKKEDIDSVIALKGKHPEFARMSLKPGIGALAMESLLKASHLHMEKTGDVAKSLRLDGDVLPLGRYLRGVLRDLHGLPEDFSKQGAYVASVAYALSFPTAVEQDERRIHRREKVAASKRGFERQSHISKKVKGSL